MSAVLEAPLKDTTLKGLIIIELDKNNDVNIVWCVDDQSQLLTFRNHPPLGPQLDKLAIDRSEIGKYNADQGNVTTYTKFKDKWLYIVTSDGAGVSPSLVTFSLALFTDTFNPEKYFDLLKLMVNLYKTTKTPTKLLECYLNVFTKAVHKGPEGNFLSSDYDGKRDHLLASPLLGVIKLFEESSWMLWSALLMKKRIAVYGQDVPSLLNFTRALPLFVLHRQDWNLLRPYVDLRNSVEVEDLEHAGVYIAGFTNPQIKQKEDLYDIYVDLSTQTISVAEHAKDDFVQTKFHQEFSTFLTMAIESDQVTDQKLIMAIKKKTGDLIGRLQKIKQDGAITFGLLSEQNLPPNMDAFLYSVASAEGMTKV